MTIILKAGDTVRAAAWYPLKTVTVGTVEDYAIQNGRDPAEMFAQTVERGQDVAWTINSGSTLYGNPAEAARKQTEDKAKAARSITLKDGDTVEIHGRLYTVKFMRGQEQTLYPSFSDPIHFRPLA
jgi:hypothetical protein